MSELMQEILWNIAAVIGIIAVIIMAIWSSLFAVDWIALVKLRSQRIHDDLNRHEREIKSLEKRYGQIESKLDEAWNECFNKPKKK